MSELLHYEVPPAPDSSLRGSVLERAVTRGPPTL